MNRRSARCRPAGEMTGDLFVGEPAPLTRHRIDRRPAEQARDGGSRTAPGIGAVRRAAVPAMVLLIVANFMVYASIGPNGILRLADYRILRTERKAELALLATERARLANQIILLDPRAVDADFADELIRRDLGLVRPDEVIIPIRN